MPPRTQLEFLTNADPSVSSNFAQTAAMPGAFHSLTPTTGASEAGMCRRLLGLVSFSSPLRGLSAHFCSLGENKLEKQGTGKSLLLWVAFCVGFLRTSPQGEAMQAGGVWFPAF